MSPAGADAAAARRTRTGRRSLLAASVLVALCVIGSSLLFLSHGNATAAAGTNCTVRDDLTEATTDYHYVGGADGIPVHGVGSSLTYYDNIYDAHGAVVGHTVGFVSAIYKRPSDGHLMTQYYESVELGDGTFSASGIVDRYAMFGGAQVNLSIIGTSGSYIGQTGTRQWWFPQPIQNPPPQETRLKLRLTLCR
ncbi:hypothetical protein ACFC09_39685 [Streptomyces sp. NPDC056161]|uniref:allene oxide cyclase barrel-like domain-containing protein n=1 Tax=Streptomyces sp. NPDC056161 TaxID=3345732 RepID=UPI0035D8C055